MPISSWTRDRLVALDQQITKLYRLKHSKEDAQITVEDAERERIQLQIDEKKRQIRQKELEYWEILAQEAPELPINDADAEPVGNSAIAEVQFAKLADLMSVNTVLASQWDVEYLSTIALMQEFNRSLSSQLEEYRVPGSEKAKQAFKAKALQDVQIAMLRNQITIENGEFVIRTESETEPKRIALPRELAENSDNQNRLLNHPYYWAAFTLVGSPW
ncbi:MAG TPA: CHAT domain-containing protein [Oscillatoriales cyanobacterium M59_W2019_021]|nr:MAG: CHAT domain-containing protein [Cyanobacteria bacterium J055]HIK30160.1 CHAT domain-containing protein [Oscillatoriales cyanobacterium M4454_W2019_049]HIK52164.1 CHAT domain-containing protein [Oscillatoriales cyanobacterium M59_W2019_021]